MAGVPTSGDMSMLKVAKERTGSGYESSISIAPPIYLADLSRLTGGNASGSGRSYPAVNLNNYPVYKITNIIDNNTFKAVAVLYKKHKKYGKYLTSHKNYLIH